jgi:type I restriction-modification system DNA methylase subunit
MSAPIAILELVDKFDQHRHEYMHHKNETELRREFLDPFFEALGWDIFNRKSASDHYKEVIHEVSVEIDGQAKAADYAFRIGDKNIFFVEAKKPSVNIETNPEPAFQLRRYGWSAKLPISILSDFEHLAVYDCRTKPDKNDKASFGRVHLYHYREYIEKWAEIAAVFSHQAVLAGAFDQFAEGTTEKKGTTEVDDAFLAEIERWRDLLARNIALRNQPPIIRNERDLNFAVQMTIDRIIFLRICEDRDIEPSEQLHEIAKLPNIYTELMALFRRADTKYNSGLFHFAEDSLTPNLDIDDKVLKDILHNLYYPESPYVFTYISANILGQVYEQFLGKVIRLTNGHQAKVEEKPEVRKAGGVFYTPTYIVDYIVENTVGKLVEGRTPKDSAKLRILDPACGSGSFLLEAYQYLLDWHTKWYATHQPERWAMGRSPAIYQAAKGEWILTTIEKKRILVDNIFGVDIDPQAVEVTKLSLLLKVLEGASGQMTLGLERVLPDLDNNIKCGNSLIGSDYYESRMFVEEDERLRVNAFDWQRSFPHVFSMGGFDAVIGNPPYIRIQAMKEWAPTEVEFYKVKYTSASKGNYDIYVVFMEKGLSLLNFQGRLGYILPHKFFNAQYGEPLRGIISTGKHISKVVHFGDQQVFDNATTYTCLMFLDKAGHGEFEFETVDDLEKWRSNGESTTGVILAATATLSEWNFSVGSGSNLFNRLSNLPVKLGAIANIFVGLQTSADTVFLFKDTNKSKSPFVTVQSKELNKKVRIETGILKSVVRSGEIGRYWAKPTAEVLFPYESIGGKFKLIPERSFEAHFPEAWHYLLDNKKLLSEREHGKFKELGWYQLYPKNLDTWEQPKIMLPYMITRLSAYYDENDYYFVNVTTGGFGITIKDGFGSYKYITGLVNSKLLDWFMKKVSTSFHGGYFAANKQFLVQLPIRTLNFSDPGEKAVHDKMVALVTQMQELQKRLLSVRTPQEKELIQRQLESTDEQIDQLVYGLYGLTEQEINIVEAVKTT